MTVTAVTDGISEVSCDFTVGKLFANEIFRVAEFGAIIIRAQVVYSLST